MFGRVQVPNMLYRKQRNFLRIGVEKGLRMAVSLKKPIFAHLCLPDVLEWYVPQHQKVHSG